MSEILKALADVINAITPRTTNPVTSVTGKTNLERNMDPATITVLITTIATIVQQCRKEDPNVDDDQLVQAARGARGVFAIRRGLRAQGMRGRRFRLAQREAVQELKQMSDEEIKEQVLNAPEAEVDEDGNDGLVYDLFN